jgi:dehydrogenase/reductase SDR family member 12
VRLHENRHIARPVAEVFAFTADFANAERWDPGVVSSRRIEDGPPGVGSKYELTVSFGSREVPMRYEITEWEQDSRVVLEGRGETIEALDVIQFEGDQGGTLVDYTADLTFTNWIRFVAPLISPVLQKVGARALNGLVETLQP